MRASIHRHLSYANVMATIAVFVALGGSAFAASYVITKSSQIKDGAVTSSDVKNSSLTGSDVKDKSLTPSDFNGSVQGPQGPKGEPGAQGPVGQTGSTDSPQQVLDKLKQVDGPGSGLNADVLDGLHADEVVSGARALLVPLEAVVFTSATASNADEAVARTAATEVPIGSFGVFTIYGKCFVDSDGAVGQPEVHTEVYARTSQDGAILDGPTSDALDGDPSFLTTGTAESARQVDVTLASGNGATTDMDNATTMLVAPDGSAFQFTINDGAKQGTLASGNGVWGTGDRCGFGFSLFGAP